jgi:hypothetical protein
VKSCGTTLVVRDRYLAVRTDAKLVVIQLATKQAAN